MPRRVIVHRVLHGASQREGPLRIVLYVRVSTIEQADNQLSLEEQERQLRDWAAREGYVVVEVYRDQGKSVSNLQRPAFQRLLKAALQPDPPFDVVFVHSLSWAFRDLTDQELTFKQLKKSGVRLLSLSENIGEHDHSSLLRKILGVTNELKSHDARIGTLRRMTATARAGYSNGARTPLGYRAVDAAVIGSKTKRRYKIDPVEAETVRLIFGLAEKGDGMRGPLGVKAIAEHLNQAGHRTRDGNLFGTGTVHEILVREDYAGAKPWNQREKDGAWKPVEEMILIPVPAIISREAYDAVQHKLTSRLPSRRGPRLDAAPSLLGGLIRCGHCGGAASPANGTSRSRQVYEYYKCSKRMKAGRFACVGVSLPRAYVEEAVTDALVEKLITRDRVLAIVQELGDRHMQRQGGEVARITALDRDAAVAEEALQNLYRLIETGVVSASEPTLRSRLETLQEKRNVAEQARDRARARLVEPLNIDGSQIDRFVQLMTYGLRHGDVGGRKAWIASVVDAIVIDATTIRIVGKKSNFRDPVRRGAPIARGVHNSVQAWCPWPESNQHSLRNSILSRARLPIPPQGPPRGRAPDMAYRAGAVNRQGAAAALTQRRWRVWTVRAGRCGAAASP